MKTAIVPASSLAQSGRMDAEFHVALAEKSKGPTFTYSPWRHGGWYVHGVRYPSGAIGCVSRNYPDKKWRVVCQEQLGTFRTRDAAAQAEYDFIASGRKSGEEPAPHGGDIRFA